MCERLRSVDGQFICRINHGLNYGKKIKYPTHLDVYLYEKSSFLWLENKARADSTRATNPPDKNNFPCMPFHQDWTDKVIEAVANNLQETGLLFFFFLPSINLPPPHAAVRRGQSRRPSLKWMEPLRNVNLWLMTTF